MLSIEGNICKENNIKDENASQNALLTTLKVNSDGVTKVQLKLRTAEGQQGSLSAFVIEKKAPGSNDPGLCALIEVPLKPLNLHERIPGLEEAAIEMLPLSRIVVRGRFSQHDGL